MIHRPHNASDGRCRYTWGAERCPAPGVRRVGRWWVCAEHVDWAAAPGDPVMQAEGRAALARQRARYGDDGRAIGEAAERAEVSAPVSRAERVERLRALRAALAAK